MSPLIERIEAKIDDLNAKLKSITLGARSAADTITDQIQALQRVKALVTPDAERALAALVKLGVIDAF